MHDAPDAGSSHALMKSALYIVTGMHRSGTSLMTRMLEAFDIALPGDLVGPAPDNEKGFFEDRDVISINDDILGTLELQWDSLDGFFLQREDFSSPKFNALKHRAGSLLRARKNEYQRWAFKDSRICRLNAFWEPLLAREEIATCYLISVRQPSGVAGSLAKRNQFADRKSLYLWFLYCADILASTQGQNRIICHYENLLQDPSSSLAQLGATLAYPPSETETRRFCDDFLTDDLDHNKSYACHQTLALSDTLYQLLQSEVDPAGIETAVFSEKFQAILADYTRDTNIRALLASLSQTERTSQKALLDLELEFADTRTKFHAEEQHLIADVESLKRDVGVYQDREQELRTGVEFHRDREAQYLAEIEKYRAREAELRTGRERQVMREEELKRDIEAQQLNLDTQIRRNTASEEKTESLETQLDDVRQQLDTIVKLQLQERAKEESRLWEIIEKYRLAILDIQQTFSWRITRPLRSVKYGLLHFLPAVRRGLFQPVKWLVYKLPEDSELRQNIIWTYARLRLGLKGEIDSGGLRTRHKQVVAHRTDILGEKVSLDLRQLPLLDISVVTHNSISWVNQFVDSLEHQAYPLEKICLTIVDNASTDETAAMFAEIYEKRLAGRLAEFNIIKSQNVGYGGGHDQAIERTHNEFLLVTNIDLEFTVDCLVKAVSFALQDETNVASWEFRQRPFEHPKYYDPVTLETSWSSHACVLLRRSAYSAVGGYEKRIFMYGEDVEFSYRLLANDYKLRYLPACPVVHHTYEEAGEVKPLQFEGSTLANAYIRLRYGSLADILGILPMFSRLLFANLDVPNGKTIVGRNIRKILINAPYFLATRKNTRLGFPIRHWDYDLTRDGPFYTSPEVSVTPLVSIVTRTYQGRETLLRQCVQSVMHQTYEPIELIVIEDGGNSQEKVVEELTDAYPHRQIKYLALDKVGRCHAGNAGLDATTGKYTMFLDDDDLLFCDHIEVCVSELEDNPELGAVYSLAWEVETAFLDGHYEEMNHFTVDAMRQEFDRELLQHHNYIAVQSILFKRKLFEDYGGFDPDLENLEDWNLWVRYSSQCDFKLISKTTSLYRTPWDMAEKAKRQASLNAYYATALKKNRAFLDTLSRGTETIEPAHSST